MWYQMLTVWGYRSQRDGRGERQPLKYTHAREKISFPCGRDDRPRRERCGMKAVDMGTVFVVHSGEPWGHAHPPCSRQMIGFLEKNEGLVTWVQVLQTRIPHIERG